MQDAADLAEAKKLPDITDIGNASDQKGVSIFLELKKGADTEKITNILYKKTRLEDSFGVNMLAIADGRPEVLSLRRILEEWLRFQHGILEKKYRVLLEKEEDKREIQEGLIAACNIIDLVIAVIRGSKNRKDAEACLTEGKTDNILFKNPVFAEDAKHLHFTKRQADAILEMRLYRLIGLEILELQKSYKETMRNIREYTKIVNDPAKREELIKTDLSEIKERYGYPRRTVIEDGQEAVYQEAAPEEAPAVFVMDRMGYCRLLDPQVYEKNRQAVEEEQKYIINCMNTSRIFLFTDKGNMYLIKAQNVPLKRLKDKGVPVDNISRYSASDEEIVYLEAYENMADKNLLFLTEGGMIKQVAGTEFDTNNRAVAGTKLEDGDRVCCMVPVTEIGLNTVAVWTDNGYFLRFALDDVPILKKSTKGVKAIRLGKGAKACGAKVVTGDPVVEYKGKQVHLHDLKTAVRGGTGSRQRV